MFFQQQTFMTVINTCDKQDHIVEQQQSFAASVIH